LPALVFVLWPVPVRRREATFLASIIGLGILPQLLIEGMNSGQAWRWAAVSALMTAALWRSQRLGRA